MKGRKPLGLSRDSVTGVNLFAADDELVKSICEKNDIKKTALLRYIVNEYLSNHDIMPLLVRIHKDKWGVK